MSISVANKAKALVLLLLICSCAVGPDFTHPKSPDATSYNAGSDPVKTVQAAGVEQSFAAGSSIPADWWTMFNSPELNATMKDALSASPTVQAAQAALRVSQNNLRAGEGVFFPQVNADAAATREKFLPQAIGESAPGNIFNLFSLSGTISYALDIFGGNRRMVEGLSAQADMQKANLSATYLTLSGNLVNTVIARAAYKAQIDDLQKVIDLENEQLRYTQIQYQAGTVPYSNVLSLKTQLAASQAALPPLKQSLTGTENLLAQLSGKLPAKGIPAFAPLASLKLPVKIPVTLPSELAHKRPDILIAEAQLHNASAQIGVATAALFPSITLDGSYGVENTNSGKLFGAASGLWSIGSGITAPIFHGGTLLSQRRAAINTYDQASANYRQTVLTAFAQVATALRALEHDAQTLQAQSDALASAQENQHLTDANYKAGLVGYTQVLIANAQYIQADSGYIQASAQRLQDTVALFVALGDGWSSEESKMK